MYKGKPLVYLGGGIKGVGYEEAKGWREVAADYFRVYGFIVADPLRGRVYQGKPDDCKAWTINEIVHRDLNDIKNSDMLFVEYCYGDKNYTGTVSEVAIARFVYNIPVIVWCGSEEREKELEYSWMGYWGTKVIPDLHDALQYAVKFYDEKEMLGHTEEVIDGS